MASLLVNKIHTNYAPTAEEAKVVRELLAGALERLSYLEDEISRLQTRLDILIPKRKSLSRDIDDHRSLLSPVRRLLPEILQEIFCHCLPTAHNSVIYSREAPLLLGRVCSQWRRIVFSTPRLWASIHISLPSPDHPLQSDVLRYQAISAWLARSGALSLSISIASRSPWRIKLPANSGLQPYLDLISPFSHRWKSIHIEFHLFDWTAFFDQYNASDLPLLETLHISGDPILDPTDEYISRELTLLGRENGILLAPRLRVLSMPDHHSHMLQSHIKWSNLIGLDLLSFNENLENLFQILRQCPNLEFCAISMPDPDFTLDIEMSNLMRVVLPKLCTLWIEDTSNAGENLLFDSLYTPELRHLNYHPVWDTPPEDEVYDLNPLHNSLSLFSSRLTNQLQELDLNAYSLPGEAVVKMLGILTGLKRLAIRSHGRLEGYPIDPSPPSIPYPFFLFKDLPLMMLTPQNVLNFYEIERSLDSDSSVLFKAWSGTCLCPQLEVFYCTGAMFSEAKLIEFLRSRSTYHQKFQTARLREVSITFVAGRMLGKAMSCVEDLRKETGMVVNVHSIPPMGFAAKRVRNSLGGWSMPGEQSPEYFGF